MVLLPALSLSFGVPALASTSRSTRLSDMSPRVRPDMRPANMTSPTQAVRKTQNMVPQQASWLGIGDPSHPEAELAWSNGLGRGREGRRGQWCLLLCGGGGCSAEGSWSGRVVVVVCGTVEPCPSLTPCCLPGVAAVSSARTS